ncbi:hypothetical protein J8273_0060 [Carpediemonas membranifera]|uniref:Uncharacterized protein n=1 Tax=Carpediemonas membranifera TaxID=201153 RepID=A0A8J6E2M1_9EUKA|nr:hypothetical protein J8273_0060 [Carpediemonas membranifera]|eukprot:KAG9394853.1 hypothetical protein J8273_0060 [Carpediemonas membranifera]
MLDVVGMIEGRIEYYERELAAIEHRILNPAFNGRSASSALSDADLHLLENISSELENSDVGSLLDTLTSIKRIGLLDDPSFCRVTVASLAPHLPSFVRTHSILSPEVLETFTRIHSLVEASPAYDALTSAALLPALHEIWDKMALYHVTTVYQAVAPLIPTLLRREAVQWIIPHLQAQPGECDPAEWAEVVPPDLIDQLIPTWDQLSPLISSSPLPALVGPVRAGLTGHSRSDVIAAVQCRLDLTLTMFDLDNPAANEAAWIRLATMTGVDVMSLQRRLTQHVLSIAWSGDASGALAVVGRWRVVAEASRVCEWVDGVTVPCLARFLGVDVP